MAVEGEEGHSRQSCEGGHVDDVDALVDAPRDGEAAVSVEASCDQRQAAWATATTRCSVDEEERPDQEDVMERPGCKRKCQTGVAGVQEAMTMMTSRLGVGSRQTRSHSAQVSGPQSQRQRVPGQSRRMAKLRDKRLTRRWRRC